MRRIFQKSYKSLQFFKRNYSKENEGLFSMWKQKVKEDLEKEKEFQENLKQVLDKEAIKKSIEAKEKIKETKDKGVEVVKKGADKVFEIVDKVVETEATQKVVKVIDKVQESEIVKDYTTYKMKEYRFRSDYKREKDKEKGLEYNPYLDEIIDENKIEKSDSTAITVIQDDSYKNKLSKVGEFLGESNNILVKGISKIIGGVSNVVGYFEQMEILKPSEQAQVVTKLKEIDKDFNMEHFIFQCQNITKQVLRGYYKTDIELLKNYCSIRCFNTYLYPRIRQIQLEGLIIESRILDISDLTLLNSTFINEKPTIVLGGTYQYTFCLKDKTNKIIEGDLEKILTEGHLWVFSFNIETKDWEIEELSLAGAIRV